VHSSSIQRHDKIIAETEWNLFLRGPGLAPLANDRANPCEAFVTKVRWACFVSCWSVRCFFSVH
jgi:hypothetical protein